MKRIYIHRPLTRREWEMSLMLIVLWMLDVLSSLRANSQASSLFSWPFSSTCNAFLLFFCWLFEKVIFPLFTANKYTHTHTERKWMKSNRFWWLFKLVNQDQTHTHTHVANGGRNCFHWYIDYRMMIIITCSTWNSWHKPCEPAAATITTCCCCSLYSKQFQPDVLPSDKQA